MAENEIKDFTPVAVEDEGQWRPLAEGTSLQGGPAVSPSEIMPKAEPQLRGTAVPSDTETQANIIRYGVPIAAGFATGGTSLVGQAAIGGLMAGASEITARQIERASTDPELDSIWQDIKAGGTVAALDAGVTMGIGGIGRGMTAVARKALLPRSMPPDVELAQTILGKMKDPSAAKKWYQFKGKSDPFSLSIGQLNNEERGFVTWIEGIARGGTGKGIMSKFDNRNAEHVATALDKYFSARTSQMTGPEFGVFMKRTLGLVDQPGEAFKPVEAFRAHLYKQFDNALEQVSDATIDGSKFRKFIVDSSDPDLLKVYGQVKAVNLLPALNSEESWKAIPVQDAEKALRLINSFRSSTDEAFNKRLSFMRQHLGDSFDKFIGSQPELKSLRDTANSYFGQKEQALYNASITSLRKSLATKPSGVIAVLDPTKGNAAVKYDQISKIKNALYFSAATPGVGASAGGIGRESAIKMYEDSIIRPLRFRFVDAASDQFGRLDPSKLVNQIEKIEAEAPEMLNELWGSPTQVKYIKELASTYQTIQTSSPERSIFIQLKTAAAVGGVAGGMWGFVNGDSPAVSSAAGAGLGAATILLSPIVLAKALANPSMTRALTDGLQTSASRGGISASLAMTLRKMGEMKVASSLFRDNPSQDTMQFYNFAPITPDE